MTLMGIVTSFGGLVAARFCLGLAESGARRLLPAIILSGLTWMT